MYSLDKQLFRLLKDEPFFASVSTRVEKISSKVATPTAGVRYNKEKSRFELYYNPDFIKNLSDDEVVGILMHEFYHIILLHVTTRADEERHAEWNICTDLAINSLIPRRMLPAVGHFPGEGVFKQVPSKKSADWYMNNIQIPESYVKTAENQFDDHQGWMRDSTVTAAAAQQRANVIIENAYKECELSKSWGSLSELVRKKLNKVAYPVNDPEEVLKFFIGSVARGERTSTIKKINKRYPYVHPGKKYKRKTNIAIAVDQSGSIDDELLKQFFSFLEKLSRQTEFTVVPFDTKINEEDIFIWKKGCKVAWERVYSGGTDFNCVVEYLKKNHFDGVIMLSDLCGERPTNSPCKRIWVTNRSEGSKLFFETTEKIIFL
jgi:predicted metal-dependent peptidase